MYVIVIPEALAMTASGWNPFTGGISIKTAAGHTFSEDKQLVISADSANNWQLVLSPDKSSSIEYTLTTASGGTKTTEFTFSAASIDAGVSQDLGIILPDFSAKTAGNYEDTLTFHVKVVDAESATGNAVDLSTLTGAYDAQDGDILTGTLGGAYEITVAAGATITLKDATITSISAAGNMYAGITCEGDATIILEGTNEVKGGNSMYPGIQAGGTGNTLTIKGSGSLTATSGFSSSQSLGAGIGGGYNTINCGNIVIEGGTIIANGGGSATGIGSGNQTSCGNITITGGNVTATGGGSAAGIGSGGDGASCGNILISGGMVNANGGNWAAGIGSGYAASCGNITITTGVTSVTATAGGGEWEVEQNSIGKGDSDTYSMIDATCGTVTIGCTLDTDGNPVGGTTGAITISPYTYTPSN